MTAATQSSDGGDLPTYTGHLGGSTPVSLKGSVMSLQKSLGRRLSQKIKGLKLGGGKTAWEQEEPHGFCGEAHTSLVRDFISQRILLLTDLFKVS